MTAQASTPPLFAPLPASLARKTPTILLCGQHQPSLLKRMEGWARRRGRPNAFLVQFAAPDASLAAFARDRFDLAIVEALDPARLEQQVADVVRVARQGLIVRR